MSNRKSAELFDKGLRMCLARSDNG